MNTHANKLRELRSLVAELEPIVIDRFADLSALGGASRQLAGNDVAVTERLAAIAEYLAGDGQTEISTRLAEILQRIDAAIKQAGGERG